MIYNIKVPKLPQFRFEWHEESKNVYFIRIGIAPEVGHVVADSIKTRGAAQMAVLIWCRGYHEGSIPSVARPHVLMNLQKMEKSNGYQA